MEIYGLDERLAVEKVGNKAAFLSLMKNNGFNVPMGIVLGNEVFNETILANSNKAKVDELLKALSKDNKEETSKNIQKLYLGLTLSDKVKSAINERINSEKKYAVRSSGMMEDLDGYSFAGQYDTFINVKGIEDIAKAVVKCYLSAYSETVLSYLASNDISADKLGMAVIIEEMVDSQASGVAFTINPTSGCDKEVYIEATKGQGELLVSGKVVASRYAYNWWNEEITLSPENYLEERITDENNPLSKEMIKEIAHTALRIQKFFGYPCDIEFACENNRLYILQARAITKILYGDIKDQWSTADFKDGGVSATVCTPYMWSLYEYIWESELRRFIIESKIFKPKEMNKKLGDMFYGRPYWNMSVVKAAMAKVPGYKERDFDSELGVKITYEGDGQTTGITPKTVFDIIRMALAQKKIVSERVRNAERLKDNLMDIYLDYFSKKDNSFSYDEITSIWKKLIFEDYLNSESTYFRQIFINTIHQSLYRDKILKHTTKGGYFSLIGGLDNVSHLLPFYDMWEISRSIRNDENAFKYWNNTPANEIVKDLKSAPLGDRVLNYIEDFGYHSKKELDVTYPSFYEDVEAVVEDIKNTCTLDDECSPKNDSIRLKEEFNNEMEKIKGKISKSAYKKLEKSVGEMRNLLWWREEFRDVSTRFYCVIRAYTLILGKALVNNGTIGEVDDIWFAKIEDIRSFLDEKISKEEFLRIIERNKVYYNSFRNFTSENEIGLAFSGGLKGTSKSSLSGIGCSCFKATGTARVIHSLEETHKLCEGDILITKFTDTGWTSKFAMLSGVVTEYGGILCHAAIVSREYGIPCVVCTENATKLIKDGETITINGETGEIIFEERERE